jgi:NAD(P)-dependent dehydrogenase (short-subunit alcohol dehydrogenase family)/acyl carrier protein
LRPSTAADHTFSADLWLLDDDGEVIAEIEGLTVRGVSQDAVQRNLTRSVDSLCHVVEWTPEAVVLQVDVEVPARHWLAFALSDGFGQALVQHLRALGDACTVVMPGADYRLVGIDQVEMDPSDPAQFDRLLSDPHLNTGAWDGVIHAWSAAAEDASPGGDLLQQQVQGCGSVLHLVQALSRAGWQPRRGGRLWLATRGAQPVSAAPKVEEKVVAPEQATLWGLGRTIALEYPDLACTLYDLDPSRDAPGVADLVAELRTPQAATQVAYRAGQRYTARLSRGQFAPEAALPVHPDASYLIAGGLGGLGLLTGEWLVQQGARALVLLGRGAPGADQRQHIADLERAGARVAVFQSDISDARQLERVFAEIERDMPPLRGVIQAAGVLEDGTLLQQDWASFRRVLAPKVAGSWNLHALTAGLSLDFFVGFSSVASVIGSPGQGSYAAANAFLDALMHYRRGQGLAGVSINWGPWQTAGMAERARQIAGLRPPLRGLSSLPPAVAFKVLARMLPSRTAQVSAFALDWSAFCAQLPSQATSTYFAGVAIAHTGGGAGAFTRGSLARALAACPPTERHTLLEEEVRAEVARVLQIQPASAVESGVGLFDLGVDSLTALELRNKLATSLDTPLRSTLVFDHPSVNALTSYLEHTILSEIGLSTGTETDAVRARELTLDVTRLSDEELAGLIEHDLAALASGGGDA